MKRFLSLMLALALIFACAPVELVKASDDDIIMPVEPPIENPFATIYYSYEIVDFEARITRCDTWISGDVTIPSTLGGYPVTSIGDVAFYDCSSLTSIEIPDSVTSIGSYAFSYCSSLNSVTIPDSVTSIGDSAFRYCSSLTSIEIPDSVTSIGDSAFSYCSSLTNIEIPDSVTSIGNYAFYNCSSLTSVVIGDSVTSIGGWAFDGCSSLTSIEIPDSVTSIDYAAFYNCSSLTDVYYDGTEEQWNAITIGASNEYLTNATIHFAEEEPAVDTCEQYLTWEIVDGEAIITDCDTAISGDVVIPDTLGGYPVTSIGDYAFWYCSSLTNIEIPDGITSIGSAAFLDCSSLTSIVIPDSVTSIGWGAFENCSSLTNVTIPDSVTSIETGAFACCESLTHIEIPASIEMLNLATFYKCQNLTSVILHEGLKEIDGAFYGCGLTEIDIPDSVQSISDLAFYSCANLKQVIIGKGVTMIDESAFGNCGKLESFYVDQDNICFTSDEFGALYNKDKTKLIQCPSAYEGNFVVPDGVAEIGHIAFAYCDNLANVSIPASVTTIDDEAFCYLDAYFVGGGAYGIFPVRSAAIVSGIYVSEDNLVYSSVDGVLYNKSKSILLQIPSQYAGNLVIPEGVTTMRRCSAAFCSALKSIAIPDTVTDIGEYAFYKCTLETIALPNKLTAIKEGLFWRSGVAEISIPYGVETIDRVAFMDCDNLIRVVIPESVISIAHNAFDSCSNLTSITIPDSVTSIDIYAFSSCDSLTSVVIPDSITSIGDVTFYNCSSLTSIEIPDSVTSIGDWAFSGCSSLTDVYYDGTEEQWNAITIGDSNEYLTNATIHFAEEETTEPNVTIIESGICGDNLTWMLDDAGTLTITGTGNMTDYYFYSIPWNDYQSAIKSVSIADGVTSIGNYAFYNCSSLTSVVIGDSVTSIGEYAFYNCSSLTGIWVDADNTAYCSDEQGVLYNKNKTTLIQAPAKGITGTYTIPDSVTSIGSYAFRDCSSLASVVIPDSVTSIGDWAFTSCSSLTSVVIPDSVTSIGDGAFYECSSLNSVTIPDSVTSIGDFAFRYCSSLTSVTIPDSVTSIGSYAFEYCSSLTSIVIPDSVTSIGSYAFFYCSSLTSIEIPDSVTSIGSYAFYECSSLESIVIPDSVTSIGDHAFVNCSSLNSVTIPDSVTSIGDSAFRYCSSLTSITIPDSVTSIGNGAFYHCSSLTNIEIPDSVTSISDDAFYGCSSLTDVYYDGTEEQWNAVAIGNSNEYLTNATIHFAEEVPTEPEETVPTEPDVPVVDENAPQIVIESKTVTKGKEFTVAVEIKNNPGFCYLELTPVIPSQFTLEKVENGELISDFTQGKQYVWIADEDVTEDGLLLTFTFLVDDSVAAGNYPVSFNVRTCGNYDEEPVTLYASAGTIEVIDFIYGDATGDDVVDGFDLIRLKKYLANYDYETESSTVDIGQGGDANGDGKIDGFDAIRLKKYLANYDYETGESTIVLGPQ